MVFRVGNGLLLRALSSLHGRLGVGTVYEVSADGIAAVFEGQKFAYSSRNFGCTGNIDAVGEAENETREAFFAEVTPGDVFYDIGAHGGVYSLTYLARCGGEVHSFEPMPEELLSNLRLNGRSAQRVHAVAVGDKAGGVRMTTKFRSSNHIDATSGDREVPIVRLDDYARERGLPDPQWIKIDIEGMELPALRGAEQLLRRAQPVVICEINQLHTRFGTTLPEFFDAMDAFGYGLWRLQGGRLHAVARGDSLAALGASADDNYWWVPRSRRLRAQGDPPRSGFAAPPQGDNATGPAQPDPQRSLGGG
jgi:FkbM family methyltransferase